MSNDLTISVKRQFLSNVILSNEGLSFLRITSCSRSGGERHKDHRRDKWRNWIIWIINGGYIFERSRWWRKYLLAGYASLITLWFISTFDFSFYWCCQRFHNLNNFYTVSKLDPFLASHVLLTAQHSLLKINPLSDASNLTKTKVLLVLIS